MLFQVCFYPRTIILRNACAGLNFSAASRPQTSTSRAVVQVLLDVQQLEDANVKLNVFSYKWPPNLQLRPLRSTQPRLPHVGRIIMEGKLHCLPIQQVNIVHLICVYFVFISQKKHKL